MRLTLRLQDGSPRSRHKDCTGPHWVVSAVRCCCRCTMCVSVSDAALVVYVREMVKAHSTAEASQCLQKFFN